MFINESKLKKTDSIDEKTKILISVLQ